jgi:TRAP-type mannitol/chloroaromatic compound transport system substrate-binding protein
MAKHLTKTDINKIKNAIHLWDGKLTWEALCEEVKSLIGKKPTRQSLNMHKDIVDVYLMKKAVIKEANVPIRKPANLIIAAQRIKNLEAENEILKKQNTRYKEQFTLWQYNSYKYGLKPHQLNEPLRAKNDN